MLGELEEHIDASDDRNYYVYSGTAGLSISLNLISNSTLTHFHFMEWGLAKGNKQLLWIFKHMFITMDTHLTSIYTIKVYECRSIEIVW